MLTQYKKTKLKKGLCLFLYHPIHQKILFRVIKKSIFTNSEYNIADEDVGGKLRGWIAILLSVTLL